MLLLIGESIITTRKLGFPSTYREIFEILLQEHLMTNEMYNAAKKLVFFRNLIAHEYYKISTDELLEMISLLEIVYDFVRQAKSEIK
ncbi:MAG: DUF86 domain-containing protein [Candidatus Thorarchaeota archaeon]|nr:DUF86 domain-containing protein [Candidatus Thorarchaeota archaeon]